MAEFPSYFSTSADFTLTTGGSVVKSFGFNATYLRVYNPGAASVWLNPKDAAASTKDIELVSSGTWEAAVPLTAGVGVFHPNMAATTTGTTLQVNVAALRSG